MRAVLLLACAGAALLACAGANGGGDGARAPTAGALDANDAKGATDGAQAPTASAPDSAAAAPCDAARPVAFADVQAVVGQRCTSCHSASGSAGPDYDWTNPSSLTAHRKNVAAEIAEDQMPPAGAPRLTADERRTLLCWGQSEQG